MASYLCLGLGIIAPFYWQANIPNIALLINCITGILSYGWIKLNRLRLPANTLDTNNQVNISRGMSYIMLLLTGFSYSQLRINHTTSQLISEPIPKIIVNGYLVTPPSRQANSRKAEFKITSGDFAAQKILLFYPESMPLQAGYNYQVRLSLQPIGNAHNIHAFDYGQYLVNNHIIALGSATQLLQNNGLAYQPLAQINRIRSATIDYLATTLKGKSYMGMAIALICGYQGLIPKEQWQIFRNSGIMHIISISGLHVTLIAAIVGILAGYLLKLLPPLAIPRQILILYIGSGAALAYCLLAGFGIPTQRTFYLLLISAWLLSLRIHIPILQRLLMTATLVLIIDPFASLSGGFWLSFGLVATIFCIVQTYTERQSKLRLWITMQLGMSLASLPISIYLFHTYPVTSIISNLWAIPVIGSFLTPVFLIATLFHLSYVLQLATTTLEWAMLPLAKIATIKPYWQAAPDLSTILLCYCGLIILFLPRSIPYKNWLGAGLFCCLFMLPDKQINYGTLEINNFTNRGAGISLISTSNHHTLLFLPYESVNQAQTLTVALLPYLQARHISAIDYIISSSKLESEAYLVLNNNQISLANNYLESSTIIDGVQFKINKSGNQLGVVLVDNNRQANYLGTGYTQINHNSWHSVTIFTRTRFADNGLDWLFNTHIDTLVISYPNSFKGKISALTDNINLNVNKIHDTNKQGSITIN